MRIIKRILEYIRKLFTPPTPSVITPPTHTPHFPKKWGWYDGIHPIKDTPITSVGNTTLNYWNGVVDRFNPGFQNLNLEGYLAAITEMLNKVNQDIIIELPYWDASGEYDELNSTLGWWSAIIDYVDSNPNVIGYYLFDEPEIWGEFGNTKPKLPHAQALSAYHLVKSKTKKDVYCVFADVMMFNQKYGGKTPFWDVFMFDFYYFRTREHIDRNCLEVNTWCFKAGSKDELAFIESQLRRWKGEVVDRYGYKRVMFVCQGHGQSVDLPTGRRIDLSSEDANFYLFGMRDMTLVEYDWLIGKVNELFPKLEGIFMWDWIYSNNSLRIKGNTVLLDWFRNIKLDN
jgi:hypothetical protein